MDMNSIIRRRPDCLVSREVEALHSRLPDGTPQNLINDTHAILNVTVRMNAELISLLTFQRHPYTGLDSQTQLEFGDRLMSVGHLLIPSHRSC